MADKPVFEPDELYTVRDIQDRLKVHGDSVRRWLRQGEIEGIDLGGRTGYRVTGHALNAFVDRRRTGKALTA